MPLWNPTRRDYRTGDLMLYTDWVFTVWRSEILQGESWPVTKLMMSVQLYTSNKRLQWLSGAVKYFSLLTLLSK